MVYVPMVGYKFNSFNIQHLINNIFFTNTRPDSSIIFLRKFFTNCTVGDFALEVRFVNHNA